MLKVNHPCARIAPTFDTEGNRGRATSDFPSTKKLVRVVATKCGELPSVTGDPVQPADDIFLDATAPKTVPPVLTPHKLVGNNKSFFTSPPHPGFLGDALEWEKTVSHLTSQVASGLAVFLSINDIGNAIFPGIRKYVLGIIIGSVIAIPIALKPEVFGRLLIQVSFDLVASWYARDLGISPHSCNFGSIVGMLD